MSETTSYQKNVYPLPVYNFRVTVDGTSMSFTEVSGISLEHETVTYRHGLSFLEGEAIKTFQYDKYVDITFKKGTVKGLTFLYDWLKEKTVRSIQVSLCDESGTPVVSWNLAKALPVKLEAPAFAAGANDLSIEALTVKARSISIQHH